MPHRLITISILAFWMSMTGWLIYREVVPMLLADDSPTVQIDLTDEVGSPLVGWFVYDKKNERIGSAISKIVANKDRSYDFRSSYHFEKLDFGPGRIRRLENVFRASEDGKLQALSARFEFDAPGVPDIVVEVDGEVEDHMLEPRISFKGQKFLTLDKIDMREQGSVVNPMLLVNRLRGLREGRSWRITLFDPFRGMTAKFIPALVKQAAAMPTLIAEVHADTLFWDRKQVACYRIDYYEPPKEPSARTWVRKIDGLVLQQEANRDGIELVLKRVPN
jgi:hypothetical protein